MSLLGIYFAPKVIDVIEIKGRKLLNSLKIPLSKALGGDTREEVSLEIKIAALFNEALRGSKITCKEAVLSLSARDLIIRTFEMPNLPNDEMAGAINFEVKKYIPFKVEDLISDYQVLADRVSRVNTVLFVGIKKETLDKYLSIFNQVNIKILRVEYCGFSIIRALKLSGAKETGIVGLLCADSGQDDEVNFMVMENGFPLFSRDISLNVGSPEGLESSEFPAPVSLDKLKAEIRVSLDYYQRKLPGKNIEKFFILANQEQYAQIEAFMAELGLTAKFINFSKIIGRPIAYSSGFAKGYSASLEKAVPIKVKINLAETSARLSKAVVTGARADNWPLLKGVKIDFRMVIAGVLICLSVFGYGVYQAMPLRRQLDDIIGKQAKVSAVDDKLNSDQLKDINSAYISRLNKLDALIKKQLYLTQALDSIPRSIPEGVWLTKFSLDKKEGNNNYFLLEGMSYLIPNEKEFEAVNKFLNNLKQDTVFKKYFTDISIISIEQRQEDRVTVTSFSFSCKN